MSYSYTRSVTSKIFKNYKASLQQLITSILQLLR